MTSVFANKTESLYFNNLLGLIGGDGACNRYSRLLQHLFLSEFYWIIPLDANRASDGIDLRKRYGGERFADAPCTVLEMLVAMARRIELDIMQDDKYGNRTAKWFWIMIDNLGLRCMDDANYDAILVDDILDRFLNRRFSRDGHGSIFFTNNRKDDLRQVQFWYQMYWYLDEHYHFDIL